MAELEEAGGVGVQPARRIVAGLAAGTVIVAGFGFATAARAGVLGDNGWQFWLALASAPLLVGLGSAWFLVRRDQVRRESAWDIFVERELERETHKPLLPEANDNIKVGTLVNARERRTARHRRYKARRSKAAQTGA